MTPSGSGNSGPRRPGRAGANTRAPARATMPCGARSHSRPDRQRGTDASIHRRGRRRRRPPAGHHPVPLDLFTVGQPFPFGADAAPIAEIRGAGVLGFLTLGRRPRPGQPVRPARARGPHRSAAVLDDGLLRRDHQRHRDLASRRSSRRSRSRPWPSRRSCGSSWPPALYTLALDGRGRGPRAEPAEPGAPSAVAACGASSSRCPRRGGTRSSRTCACSRSTTPSTRPASTSRLADTPVGRVRRWFARVVLGERTS